jgi:hypothetical protein
MGSRTGPLTAARVPVDGWPQGRDSRRGAVRHNDYFQQVHRIRQGQEEHPLARVAGSPANNRVVYTAELAPACPVWPLL